MVPPVDVPIPPICPAVVVSKFIEFVVSIPLVLLNESAMPSAMIVVVACSVEDADLRARRVMFFCESKSPATSPEFKMQEPPIEKQPFVRLMPLANVLVAVVDVILSALAESPFVNVEVAEPEVMLMEPSVELIPLLVMNTDPVPTCRVPFTHRLEAKVEVALVPVPLTSMKPARVVVPVPPKAALPELPMVNIP